MDADTLYALLPAIYRARDAERGEPLKALLAVLAGQAAAVEENLAQLYDDQFIETAAAWARAVYRRSDRLSPAARPHP